MHGRTSTRHRLSPWARLLAFGFDASAWAFMLGLAALCGVVLDRVAYEHATRVAGGLCALGAFGMLLRWVLVARRVGRNLR